MKKILLFLYSLLFFCSAKAQTNVYHPFPDSNAVWNHYYSIHACTYFTINPHLEIYSYVLSGDTVLGAFTYHKLEKPYVEMLDTCWSFPLSYPIGYAGCFREDTMVKKIFFVNAGDSAEQILYDFNLIPGDTVKSFLINDFCWSNDIVVTNLDSVLIDGSYRKRWEWSSQTGHTTYVVEGIGSLSGLLEPACEMIDGPEIYLSCFKVNDSLVFVHPTYGDAICQIINTIATPEVADIQAHFYPNPFYESTTLEMTLNAETMNAVLSIYSSLGGLVYRSIIKDEHSVITKGKLSEGIYFYQLTSRDFRNIGKGKLLIK